MGKWLARWPPILIPSSPILPPDQCHQGGTLGDTPRGWMHWGKYWGWREGTEWCVRGPPRPPRLACMAAIPSHLNLSNPNLPKSLPYVRKGPRPRLSVIGTLPNPIVPHVVVTLVTERHGEPSPTPFPARASCPEWLGKVRYSMKPSPNHPASSNPAVRSRTLSSIVTLSRVVATAMQLARWRAVSHETPQVHLYDIYNRFHEQNSVCAAHAVVRAK